MAWKYPLSLLYESMSHQQDYNSFIISKALEMSNIALELWKGVEKVVEKVCNLHRLIMCTSEWRILKPAWLQIMWANRYETLWLLTVALQVFKNGILVCYLSRYVDFCSTAFYFSVSLSLEEFINLHQECIYIHFCTILHRYYCNVLNL